MTSPARSNGGSARSSSITPRCSWCRPARRPMHWHSRMSVRRGGGVRACRGAYPYRRMRRAGIFRRRPQACRHAGHRLQGDAGNAGHTVVALPGPPPHQVVPAAFSFAQGERGRHDLPAAEIAALARIAHARGMKVHMDGARFANALVRMNASPAEITWKAGVDVLSFGATKGGAMAAEAGWCSSTANSRRTWPNAASAPDICSRETPLPRSPVRCVSRQRLLAAACPPRQRDGRSSGLPPRRRGLAPAWPVEANLVFLALPKTVEARLKAAGAR